MGWSLDTEFSALNASHLKAKIPSPATQNPIQFDGQIFIFSDIPKLT